VNHKRNSIHFAVGLIALTLGLILVGCGVGVPSKASFNVRRIDNGGVDQGVMVTLGPRKLLEKLSKEIVNNNKKIEIVDGLLFRDTAFPEGDWSLERVLEPKVRSRVSDALNVDYLILLGSPESASGKGEGFFIPMAIGAGSGESSTKISAVIIDLKKGGVVTQIESVGSGTGLFLYYVIFIVASEPQTETGAIEGLAMEIGDVLVENTQSKRIRIAVMAMEPMDEHYAASARRQTLRRQLDEGGYDSYELKVELARLGDSEPLKTLAKEGDRQASIDLYQITGNSGPLYQLAKSGDPEAKTIVEAIEARKSREEKLAVAAETDRAKAGSAEAQFQMYMRINTSDPLVWLCRAADGGHPYARYRLGLLYEHGIEGVEQNNARAHMWYVRASESGHPWGDANADRIQRALTTDDVKESARLLLYSRPGQCEIDVAGRQEN